ncbi:MAG: FecR domain-containing protein, partial [Methylococcales bacterium]
MKTIWKKIVLNLITAPVLLINANSLTAAEDEWIYQVVSGDNLWNLTEKYLRNMSYVQRIQALNHIADPFHVPPDTKLRIPTRWLATSQTVAQVESVQGVAEAIEEHTGKVKVLYSGSLLMAGDAVRTGENSILVIQFIDGSSLTLMANSYLTLKHLSVYNHTGMTDTRLDLQRGRLETQVARRQGPATRFQISTPSAVTSVRGTDYRVSSDLATVISRTEVLHGGVAVSNQGKTLEIPKGFGTLTAPNQAPSSPIELLPAPDLATIPGIFEQIPLQFPLPVLANQQSYRIQIAATASFHELLFDQKITSASARGSELPDGNYYLRIRRIDEHGLEGNNADKAVVINARPEAPFLIAPKPEAGVTEPRPYLLWSGQKNVHNYHVQIAKDKDFKDIVINQAQVADVKFAPDQDLPLGHYFWRVASVDEQHTDGPFTDGQPFKRIAPAPELDEPEIADETILLRARSAALTAQKYQFQIAKDELFKDILIDQQVPQPQ